MRCTEVPMNAEGFQEISYAKNGVTRIGVGVLGYGFMGKVHSNAFLKIPYTYTEPAAFPELIAMCGRNREKLEDAARRFKYRGIYTDWRQMIEDPDIELFDNCTPDNLHREPSIAAAKRGKHVICEKPLAMNVEDARAMRDAVASSRVKHMLCHNYRFMPAVRLARNLIEREELGTIYQFRGRYLQEVGHNPGESTQNVWYATGTRSGVLLGIGCHIIDIARFLIGEIKSVSGEVKTFNKTRKDSSGKGEKVTSDEVNCALVEFENGSVGTLESAGVSTGRKNQLAWEINGSKGSISFDLEDLNHLSVCLDAQSKEQATGFTNVSVTDGSHPLQSLILPPGHNAGWEYGHVHALNHFIECIVRNKPVEPYGATFEDGYRIQVIMNAIVDSSQMGKRVEIKF
jgi:predicted dehydrogenase